MEYLFNPPVSGLCGTPEHKRVALWYVFSIGLRRFLFFKLEGDPALSLGHAASAAARYILKRDKPSKLPRRREDAYKNRGGLDPSAALSESRANASTLWPDAAAEAAAYDRDIRIGRELFVPASVVARLAR